MNLCVQQRIIGWTLFQRWDLTWLGKQKNFFVHSQILRHGQVDAQPRISDYRISPGSDATDGLMG